MNKQLTSLPYKWKMLIRDNTPSANSEVRLFEALEPLLIAASTVPDEKIYNNLCNYDERSPYYDVENGSRKKDCSCDNCFYNRHELALMLLNIKNATVLNLS